MSRWNVSAAALVLLLLCGACRQQRHSSVTDAKPAAAEALSPQDPGYVAEDPQLARLVGSPGPGVTLKTIEGKTIDVGALYGGKPVYLKLWATYCIPCRVQMPGFEKIYETFGNRINVIAVNAAVGDDVAKVRAFVEKNGMHMPVAIDDGSLGTWLKLRETPLHLVIGRDGRIVYAGHQDGAPLDAAIRHAIDGPAVSGPVVDAKVADVVTLKPGDIVPALGLLQPEGTSIHLRGDARRPRALFFTSVWCEDYLKQTEPRSVAACRRMREAVGRLALGGRMDWLGIVSHMWTTPGDVAAYRTRTGQRIPFVMDSNGAAFRLFGIHRFPAVALIDGRGRLLRVIGPEEPGLRAAVDAAAKTG